MWLNTTTRIQFTKSDPCSLLRNSLQMCYFSLFLCIPVGYYHQFIMIADLQLRDISINILMYKSVQENSTYCVPKIFSQFQLVEIRWTL